MVAERREDITTEDSNQNRTERERQKKEEEKGWTNEVSLKFFHFIYYAGSRGSTSGTRFNAMPPIHSLPVELLLHVVGFLDDIADLSALCRCDSRYFHHNLTPLLYSRAVDECGTGVLLWACDEGRVGTVRRLLAAGADPSEAWAQPYSHTVGLMRPLQEEKISSIPLSPQPEIIYERPREESCNADLNEAWELDSLRNGEGEPIYVLRERWKRGHNSERYAYENTWYSPPEDAPWSRWTALHVAARWGHDEIATLLLDHGADVNASSHGLCDCIFPVERTNMGETAYMRRSPRMPDFPNWLPLHTAICHGNESTVRLLLDRGASMVCGIGDSTIDRMNVHALHSACAAGDLSIVRLLVDEFGADIESQDQKRNTPISYAYFTGMWECIGFLIERGASINVTLDGEHILSHACRESRFAEGLRMIDLWNDPGCQLAHDLCSTIEMENVICAAVRGCAERKRGFARVFLDMDTELRMKRQKHLRSKMLGVLARMGRNFERLRAVWIEALGIAAGNRLSDAVGTMIKGGPEETLVPDENQIRSVLFKILAHEAPFASGDLFKTVSVLLRLGRPHMTSNQIVTAMNSTWGKPHNGKDRRLIVRLLSRYRKDADFSSAYAKGFWMRAITNHDVALCKSFLRRGLKAPPLDDVESLAIKAIYRRCVPALAYLYTLPGVDGAEMTGKWLYTAIWRFSGRCVDFLLSKGAPIEHMSSGGSTTLSMACQNDRTLAVKLLQMGADPNRYDEHRRTAPLLRAIERNYDVDRQHEDVTLIEALLAHGAKLYYGPDDCTSCLGEALEAARPAIVKAIAHSDAFKRATPAQHARAIADALGAWPNNRHGAAKFNLVISVPGIDLDVDSVLPAGGAALHAVINQARYEAIGPLIRAGANMHKRTERPAVSDAATQDSPKYFTPLEWAILRSDVRAVRELLSAKPLRREDAAEDPTSGELRGVVTRECLIDYIRAACSQRSNGVIRALVRYHLDFKLCDSVTGDTAVHMICDRLGREPIRPASNGGVLSEAYDAGRCAAMILVHLIHGAGVDPVVENRTKVSGLTAVRRVMEYDGGDERMKGVARAWRNYLCVDDHGITLREGKRRIGMMA